MPDHGTERAAVYCRISRDQELSSLGVARQEKIARAICADRGWSVEDVFTDNDLSATEGRTRRPRFEDLLTGVTDGHFDVVVAVDLDRLTRSHKDLLRLVEACTKHGVRVALQSGGFDPITGDGMLEIQVRTSVAEEEIRKLRQRITRKTTELAAAGKIASGGIRQFGYVDGRRTAVNEAEAEVIRGAAHLLLSGASKGEVVRYMRDRCPPVRGGRWTMSQAMNVLNSAALAGIREHHVKDRARRYVANDHARWPAIIDRETHERLRAIIERRAGTGDRTRSAEKYLLSGIARCGLCGAPLCAQPKLRNPDGTPNRSYRCPQPNGANGLSGCGRIRIQADPLEAHVVQQLLAFATHPDVIKRQRVEDTRTNAQERTVRAALEKVERRQANLTQAVLNGLPPAEFKRAQADLTREREALEKRLSTLTSRLTPAIERGHTAEVVSRWADLTVNERRSVITSLLGEPSEEGVEAHRRFRREHGLPLNAPGHAGLPPLVVAPLVVHPGVKGRNTFDSRRVEVHPDWGPLLASAAALPDDGYVDDGVLRLDPTVPTRRRRKRASTG